jgi:hypothetical protein
LLSGISFMVVFFFLDCDKDFYTMLHSLCRTIVGTLVCRGCGICPVIYNSREKPAPRNESKPNNNE